jgi:hypothetical protein
VDVMAPNAGEIARALLELWEPSGGLLYRRDGLQRLVERFGVLTQLDGRLDLDSEALAEFRRLAGPRVVFDSGSMAWREDRRRAPLLPDE